MSAVNQDFLNLLKDDYKKYSCFIETGTYFGNTILKMVPFFDKLYTIEFSEKYYNLSKNRYNGDKIDFILGDSSVVFETLLPTINDKTIFYLDGHWSSGDTGKSTKDCPLNEEITHINNLFKNEAIIIIDDFRLFGLDKSGKDWTDINKENLLNILKDRVTKVYHLPANSLPDDRLIIHINAKS